MNFPPREVAVFQILKCDRREQNNPGKSFSVGLYAPNIFYKLDKLRLVLIDSFGPAKDSLYPNMAKTTSACT